MSYVYNHRHPEGCKTGYGVLIGITIFDIFGLPPYDEIPVDVHVYYNELQLKKRTYK